MRDAAQGPRGERPGALNRPRTPATNTRSPGSPRVTINRSEEWYDRRYDHQEPNELNPILRNHRQRRLSIQSYSSTVSNSDESNTDTDTEDISYNIENEIQHREFMSVNGQLYRVEDTYEDTSYDSNEILDTTVGNNPRENSNDNNETFFGVGMV